MTTSKTVQKAPLFAPRPLYVIAQEIRNYWPNVYFGAVPYLNAMATMASVHSDYGCDSGESIVLYFLSNARAWKGAAARRIKAELKALVTVKEKRRLFPKKVYIVFQTIDYEGSDIHSVHATQEGAQKALDAIDRKALWWIDNFSIASFEVRP